MFTRNLVNKNPFMLDTSHMRLPRNGTFSFGLPTVDDDRRQSGRLRCEGTRCTKGKVLDISLTGLYIERRGKPIPQDEYFQLTVRYDRIEFTFPVRVIRVEKIRFRKYRYGLKFVELDEQQQRILREFSQLAADRMMIA